MCQQEIFAKAVRDALGDLGLEEVMMKPLITNKGAVAEEGRAP